MHISMNFTKISQTPAIVHLICETDRFGRKWQKIIHNLGFPKNEMKLNDITC